MRKLVTKFIQSISNLRVTKLDIFLLFTLIFSRFYMLGRDIVNQDAFHFKNWSYVFMKELESGNFDKLPLTIQPGVLTIYSNILGFKSLYFLKDKLNLISAEGKDFELVMHTFQKIPQALLIIALVILMFYLISKVFDVWTARIFSLLYIFDPLSILHGRVIQTDGLQSTLILASILTAFYSLDIEKKKSWILILSGFIGALAFLQKSPSIVITVYIIGVFVFHQVYLKYAKGVPFKILDTAKHTGLWLLSFMLSTVALYPVYWGNPLVAFKRMTIDAYQFGVEGVNTENYTYDKYVSSDLFSPAYLEAFLYKNSEFMLFGLLIGIFIIGYFIYKHGLDINKINPKFIYIFYTLIFCLGYLLMLQLSEKKFPRYIIVVTTPLLLVTAYAIKTYFVEFFDNGNKILRIFIGLLITWGGLNYFYYMPDIGAYQNVFGRLAGTYITDGGTGRYRLGQYISSTYGPEEKIITNNHMQFYLFYPGEVINYHPNEVKVDHLIIFQNEYVGLDSELVKIDEFQAKGNTTFHIYRHNDYFIAE